MLLLLHASCFVLRVLHRVSPPYVLYRVAGTIDDESNSLRMKRSSFSRRPSKHFFLKDMVLACQREFFLLLHPMEDRTNTFVAVELSDLKNEASTSWVTRDGIDLKGTHPFLLNLGHIWLQGDCSIGVIVESHGQFGFTIEFL